jgi:hypothetical protein
VVLAETWRARVVGRAKGTTVERRGPSLQLAAWGLPALQTVAVLVMRDVDADELTGNLSRYLFSLNYISSQTCGMHLGAKKIIYREHAFE